MSRVEPQIITKSNQEVTREILAITHTMGPGYKKAVVFFGLLLLLGIIGFIIRAVDAGFNDFRPWGYFMAGYAFLLTTASTAPLFSISQRMVHSHWRRPMARASEMFGVVGVLSTLMFIPMIALLPSSAGRRSIWFEWPGTPLYSDTLAVVFLAVLGIVLLYVAALPDLAVSRLHATGTRRKILDRIVIVNWKGTERQWAVHRASLRVLGALYFLFLVLVHTIIASDFAEALVPGWKDAIFPAFHVLSGFQSAVASTVVALFLLYKFGGYKDYIAVDQFWAASKLLLPLCLLWMYFWFSGFIVYWYGRQPVEQTILRTFMFEAYLVPFLLGVMLSFVVPFLIVMWNFVRKTILGPTIVATLILFGALFDRIRIYVASFSIADMRPDGLTSLEPEALSAVPRAVLPGAPDVMMILGTIGGAIFLYLLAIKLIPPVSIWEVKEGMLYRRRRKYLKTEIMVMGKPE